MSTKPSHAEAMWVDPLINFLAVLLGAALAWGTSYFFETKREKSENLALAYSLIFKLQALTDRLMKLDRHIRNCAEVARSHGGQVPNWAVVTEVIGYREPLEPITAAELALVAKTKDSELAMSIRELESGHSICFESFEHVIAAKKQLSSTGLITKVEGEIVSFEATQEQFAQLQPMMIGMEAAARGLFEMLPRVAANARKIAKSLGPKLKNQYGFKHFIALSFEDDPENAS